MLRLRPYKKDDADRIMSWCRDERTFLLWGGDHFGSYPVPGSVMHDKYTNNNGDCEEPDNFYPLTAVDENNEAVGHFIIRYIYGDPRILRFGWVILDDSKRGQGLGKEMLTLGLHYAFDIMKAKKVTIGVFENNAPALYCYLSTGFHTYINDHDFYLNVLGEEVKVIELEITREEYYGK